MLDGLRWQDAIKCNIERSQVPENRIAPPIKVFLLRWNYSIFFTRKGEILLLNFVILPLNPLRFHLYSKFISFHCRVFFSVYFRGDFKSSQGYLGLLSENYSGWFYFYVDKNRKKSIQSWPNYKSLYMFRYFYERSRWVRFHVFYWYLFVLMSEIYKNIFYTRLQVKCGTCWIWYGFSIEAFH